MISIGNDIISLKHINAERTVQKKFYSKILSESEAELFNTNIIGSISFENFVWLAWSVKESVYKFHKRNNPQLLFSPVKIIIDRLQLPIKQKQKIFGYDEKQNVSLKKEECFCCEINFNSNKFYTRSIIYNDIIFTVANNANCFENIYWGIKNIGSDLYSIQSQKVREFGLSKMNEILNEERLSFAKSDTGYPYLIQKKNIAVSFSHHGCFVSYAFYS